MYVIKLCSGNGWRKWELLLQDHIQRWNTILAKWFVNKQNMHCWTRENPHMRHETSLHPKKNHCLVRISCRWRHWFILVLADENESYSLQSHVGTYFFLAISWIGHQWYLVSIKRTSDVTIELLKFKFGERLTWRNGLNASIIGSL